MTTQDKKIGNIHLKDLSKKEILEKIVFYNGKKSEFIHIVSINPENVVIASEDKNFEHVLNEAEIHIFDGIGILLGGSVMGFKLQDRLTGVDMMDEVIKTLSNGPTRVLLLGGKQNLAEKLSDCYQEKYPRMKFLGLQGFKNIQQLKNEENEAIFSIVSDFMPQIIFAAYGSPWQEKWFYENRAQLQGIICMGVGGGFDFLSGEVKRAPVFMRKLGLEWLFRLVTQPWRWRRQLRLFTFIYLIFKQKFSNK
jgi:N-acetylglucosaminyldiphosphoundecaprenol N-acetyl-beta-D-mannosaminyltransferase